MKPHARRKTRYLVLEALYEGESTNHDPEEVFLRRLAESATEDQALSREGLADFGRAMIRGVVGTWREADRLIAAAAPRYAVETLAVVDRNILRLAIWELLTDNSAPVAAVVNEAVELAHRYGGESSPAFVNGVLRTVSKTIQARGKPENPPASAEFISQENQ